MHDVVHPLVELRPVAHAAVVWRGRHRLESRSSSSQLRRRSGAAAPRGTRGGSSPSASMRPGSASTMSESVIVLAREPRRGSLDRRRGRQRRGGGRWRRTPPPARADGTSASSARRPRSSCVADGASSASRISGCSRVCSWSPISRLASTASSARALGRVPPAPLVAREGLAQQALAFGRFARPQASGKLDGSARSSSARTAGRSPRTPCRLPRATASLARSNASNGVWSSAVSRPSRVSRLKQAAPQQPAPERRDRMQQPAAVPDPALEVAEQVLPADRPTRLPRRPGRVRAPVRALADPGRDRGGETRVAVRDLEVADDRVLDRNDPLEPLPRPARLSSR